jgi:hypothetical protein
MRGRLLPLLLVFLLILPSIVLTAPYESAGGSSVGLWDEIWMQREMQVGQEGARLQLWSMEQSMMLTIPPVGVASTLLRLSGNDAMADTLTSGTVGLLTGINVDATRGTVGTSIGDMVLNLTMIAGAIGVASRIGGTLGRVGSAVSRALRLEEVAAGITTKIPALAKAGEKLGAVGGKIAESISAWTKSKLIVREPDTLLGKVFKLAGSETKSFTGRIAVIDTPDIYHTPFWHVNTDSKVLSVLNHQPVKTVIATATVGIAYAARTVQRAGNAVTNFVSSLSKSTSNAGSGSSKSSSNSSSGTSKGGKK